MILLRRHCAFVRKPAGVPTPIDDLRIAALTFFAWALGSCRVKALN